MKKINIIVFLLYILMLTWQVGICDVWGERPAIFDVKADARIQGLGGAGVILTKSLSYVAESPAVADFVKAPCVTTSHMKILGD